MSEVIVRYGCDGCSRLFESLDGLKAVKTKFLRSAGYDNSRDGMTFHEDDRMYCQRCLDGFHAESFAFWADQGMLNR